MRRASVVLPDPDSPITPSAAPRRIERGGHVGIDPATRDSLEICRSAQGEVKGSLWHEVDRCVTAAGRRLLAADLSAPLTDRAAIEARLALVQFFSWFALFAMWIYTTAAVAGSHFGSADPTSAAYNEGANWVNLLFTVYNGVAAVAAL